MVCCTTVLYKLCNTKINCLTEKMVKLVIIIIFHLKKALRMNLQGPILEKGKVF